MCIKIYKSLTSSVDDSGDGGGGEGDGDGDGDGDGETFSVCSVLSFRRLYRIVRCCAASVTHRSIEGKKVSVASVAFFRRVISCARDRREEHTQTVIEKERERERERTAATVPTDRSSPVKKRREGRPVVVRSFLSALSNRRALAEFVSACCSTLGRLCDTLNTSCLDGLTAARHVEPPPVFEIPASAVTAA